MRPFYHSIITNVAHLPISAAFSSLRSIIVVDLMGLDKLTTSFGQLSIFNGMAVMIGTPIAGKLEPRPFATEYKYLIDK